MSGGSDGDPRARRWYIAPVAGVGNGAMAPREHIVVTGKEVRVSTRLAFTSRQFMTATLGHPSALSMLQTPYETRVETHDVLDSRMADGLTRGRLTTALPYVRQSGYDRTLTPQSHPVAILEGERLRATFLLDLGGRLWSLVDLTTGRELLYSNAGVQFANLAIRDAWFAGGVEWNVGLIGHTPLTCSPMHAARVDSERGPVLRLWEFDRLRDCVYRIDAWLDESTGLLCVRPEVHNPNADAVDTYWWSNAAVPMTENTRVLTPAGSAWKFDFEKVMRKVPVGGPGDDSLWPARAVGSADYFFDLDGSARPWIAAVEPDGTGMVQTSTAALEGRKLFVWGRGPGGRHWQEWLSPLGGEYAEIQSGLARTQMEHLPLGPGESFHWVETYGPLAIDPAVAGADHLTACAGVDAAIQAVQPNTWLADVERAAERVAALAPTAIEHRGSGWGALERVRREAGGDDSLSLDATPFPDDSLTDEQVPWLALLRDGTFPQTDPLAPPGSYQRSAAWTPLLETDATWRALLHLGEIRWHAGDAAGAREAWLASAATPNPWAWRDLGVAALADGDPTAAAESYARACALLPDDRDLLLERLDTLLALGRTDEVLDILDSLAPAVRSDPRVRVAEARAALGAGRLERALQALTPLPELATLREGDDLLDALWRDLQEALAAAPATPLVEQWRARGPRLPYEWDFRMTRDADEKETP